MTSRRSLHVSLQSQLAMKQDGFTLNGLQIYQSVPDECEVMKLNGFVLVYDPEAVRLEGIADGSFYVVEYQKPVGGMDWDTYDRFNRTRGHSQPRVRIATKRQVVRPQHWKEDRWWHVLPSGSHDGPMPTGLYAAIWSAK